MFIGSHINTQELQQKQQAHEQQTKQQNEQQQKQQHKRAKEEQYKQQQKKKKQQERQQKQQEKQQAYEKNKKQALEKRKKGGYSPPRNTPGMLDPQEKRHLQALLKRMGQMIQALEGQIGKVPTSRHPRVRRQLQMAMRRAHVLASQAAHFRQALFSHAQRE